MACAPVPVAAEVAAAAAAPAAPVGTAARTARLAVAALRTCDAASPSVTSDSPLTLPAQPPRKPSSAAAFAIPIAAAGMLLLQSAAAAAPPASIAATPPPTQQTRSHTSPLMYSLQNAEPEPDATEALYLFSAHGPHSAAYGALAAAPSLVNVAEVGPLPQQQQLPYSTADSPYFSRQQPLGLEDGRIQACPSATNPNCISTSSFNESYAEPWEVPRASVANAPRKVESAILATQKNAVIVASQPVDNGFLIIAEVDGLLGRDSIEVLIRTDYDYKRDFDSSSSPSSPTSPPSPREADDDGTDDNIAVVLYRCMSSRVVYVYPFTTPITEFGAQRKRMDAIGDELGWRRQAAACDFGVCSEFEDAEDEGTIRREPRILPLW